MRPSGSCTVCASPDREAIDRSLATKSASLRALARQFGLSKDAIYRHGQHSVSPVNAGSAGIDKEIVRLRRAQANAERRRDSAAATKISAELRSWTTLKIKAESFQTPEKAADQGLSRKEALATAQAIIEMELAAGAPGLRDWLQEILASISKAATTDSTTFGLKVPDVSELSV
jgi:transposase-like protein